MSTHPISLKQVAQHATDLDRAEHYYSLLTGSPSTARYGGLLFFDLAGVRLLLEDSAPSATLYLQVDSIQDVLDRLGELATIHTQAHVIFTHEDDTLGPAGHDEIQAFLTDSEENLVGLIEYRKHRQHQ